MTKLFLVFCLVALTGAKDLGPENTSESIQNNLLGEQIIKHKHQNGQFDENQHQQNYPGQANYNNYSNNGPSDTSTQNSYSTDNEDQNKKSSWVDDVVIGALMFFGCFLMLIMNERRFVKTGKRLQQAHKECFQLDPREIDPRSQGKLVCAPGLSFTNEVIFDPKFAANVMNCIKLRRNCEMYQWQEHKRTRQVERNGKKHTETYYEYTQDWYDHYIDSNSFREHFYQNDRSFFFEQSETFKAQNVNLDAFRLSESQKDQCNNFTNVPISQEIQATGMTLYRPQQFINIQGNYLYFCRNQGQTQLGDFRVSFQKVECGDLTVVAKQVGDTFDVWKITSELGSKLDDSDSSIGSNNDNSSGEINVSGSGCCGCCGCICQCCKFLNKPLHDIDWVFEGEKLKKKQVFQKKADSESTRTNLQRFGGWLGLCISIWLMLSPIYSLLYWFPWVGKFLGTIGSFICGFIGFILGSLISGLTIGISWIWYRPKIGIPIAVGCSALLLYIIYSSQNHETQPVQAA